jgi:hypothetical protein
MTAVRRTAAPLAQIIHERSVKFAGDLSGFRDVPRMTVTAQIMNEQRADPAGAVP